MAVLFLTLTPARVSAISQPLPPLLAWGDRVVRDGIELEVRMAPEGRALRERDRVTFRFRIADEGGRPIPGLRPAAWLEPLAPGQSVDPTACVREMETGSGWRLVKTPALLDLDLHEGGRPGTYEALARMGRPGRYGVAFFLGSPRLVHCFEVEVQPAGRSGIGP
ncbi:MAG: hypothetical protein ACJ759_12685 [Thermoanaerobaculia bacterium]